MPENKIDNSDGEVRADAISPLGVGANSPLGAGGEAGGNRLRFESSPYLLQHAHNPVDWYPWGAEAFEKAIREDKPILVSIGYAACHWCHVMERESFEKDEVASIMNDHFVNIKVDREERPDVDHIYMDAVQAMTGSGGWPLNVFLTPDRKPFYGGTYFPPVRAFNRASWSEVLFSVTKAYKEQKEEIETQAKSLTEHIKMSNAFGMNATGAPDIYSMDHINNAFLNISKLADREWGGFGRAPKFPQTFTITFLLQYAHLEQNQEALDLALLSLDKMIQGGIYDHIGGGFARYSTDNEWLAPHFEKMLYDNALLVSALGDAFLLTSNSKYKEVIVETMAFIERELMHSSGGFFSALDADSEGVEGKFYVWEYDEVKDLLGSGYEHFTSYFDITPDGNWERKNIPRTKVPLDEFLVKKGLKNDVMDSIIKNGKRKLLEARKSRVRPALDDKVLLGWNALMNTACCKAYSATGNDHYLSVSRRNMDFLLSSFKQENGLFYHTWKNGKASQPAFLDDYSYLVSSLIELGQVSANLTYFDKAYEIMETAIEYFSDEASSFFYFTHKDQKDILLRKKEIHDGATPSGNSVMAYNLYRLSILFNRQDWRSRSEGMLSSIGEMAIKYPTSFGIWLSSLYEIIRGTNEIAIVGKDWEKYLVEVLSKFIPHKLVMASSGPVKAYPLLEDKAANGQILIYLCRNYACNQPVNSVSRLLSLLTVK